MMIGCVTQQNPLRWGGISKGSRVDVVGTSWGVVHSVSLPLHLRVHVTLEVILIAIVDFI